MDKLSNSWSFEALAEEAERDASSFFSSQASNKMLRSERLDIVLRAMSAEPAAQFTSVVLLSTPTSYSAPYVRFTIHFKVARWSKSVKSGMSTLFNQKTWPPCLRSLKSMFPVDKCPEHLGVICPLCEVDPHPFTLFFVPGVKLSWIKTSNAFIPEISGQLQLFTLSAKEKKALIDSQMWITPDSTMNPVVFVCPSAIKLNGAVPWTLEKNIAINSIPWDSRTGEKLKALMKTIAELPPEVYFISLISKQFRDLIESPSFYQEFFRFYSKVARFVVEQTNDLPQKEPSADISDVPQAGSQNVF